MHPKVLSPSEEKTECNFSSVSSVNSKRGNTSQQSILLPQKNFPKSQFPLKQNVGKQKYLLLMLIQNNFLIIFSYIFSLYLIVFQ